VKLGKLWPNVLNNCLEGVAKVGVPVKCETKQNTTKRNEIRRSETKYANWETKRNETRSFNEFWKKIIPRRMLYVRVYLRNFTL
jgi:hypothetical protein